MLKVSLLDLVHGELAVTVLVEGLEDLGQVVALRFAHELRGNESVRGLLEGDVRFKFAKVVESAHGEAFVHLNSGELGEPRVLESLLG